VSAGCVSDLFRGDFKNAQPAPFQAITITDPSGDLRSGGRSVDGPGALDIIEVSLEEGVEEVAFKLTLVGEPSLGLAVYRCHIMQAAGEEEPRAQASISTVDAEGVPAITEIGQRTILLRASHENLWRVTWRLPATFSCGTEALDGSSTMDATAAANFTWTRARMFGDERAVVGIGPFLVKASFVNDSLNDVGAWEGNQDEKHVVSYPSNDLGSLWIWQDHEHLFIQVQTAGHPNQNAVLHLSYDQAPNGTGLQFMPSINYSYGAALATKQPGDQEVGSRQLEDYVVELGIPWSMLDDRAWQSHLEFTIYLDSGDGNRYYVDSAPVPPYRFVEGQLDESVEPGAR
jgi:hypothetical protein